MTHGAGKYLIPLFAMFLVSACNMPLDTSRGTGLTTGIERRAILANKVKVLENGKEKEVVRVCAEPSPDATQNYLLELLAKGGRGPGTGEGKLDFSSEQEFVGLRTQSIQLLRDAMFRSCEAYLNGAIDAHGYYTLLRRHQKTMMGLLAIESLTGTVRTSDSSASLQRALAKVSLRIMEINHTLNNKSNGDTTPEQITQLEEERKDLKISEKNLSTALAGAQRQSSNLNDLAIEASTKIPSTVERIARMLISINDGASECLRYYSDNPSENENLDDYCTKTFQSIVGQGRFDSQDDKAPLSVRDLQEGMGISQPSDPLSRWILPYVTP